MPDSETGASEHPSLPEPLARVVERIAARNQKGMAILSEQVEAGEFVPPCHEECEGDIVFLHEGERYHALCPMFETESCPIPVYALARRRKLIAETGNWPKRYWTKATWDMCRAKDVLQKWLEERDPDEGLLLHGPVGTGKTCATFLVAEALHPGLPSKFTPWVQIAEGFSSGMSSEKRERLHRWASVPLLVIDDFGVGEMAPWAMGFVDNLFELRNSEMKTTIVTTNLTPKSLRAEADWQRFVDRWAESMTAVAMPGASMRKKG